METTVKTTYGALQGVKRQNHQVYLGIPYARPPVGKLRFAAPEPSDKWDGVRQATAFSASSIQSSHPIPGFAADGPISEDCLYLNVYTPAADDKKRPVMFWVHGGGFTHGTADSPIYNGGFLAELGDVVVVTINYRLGALGFLYLGDHGGKAWGASANCGLLDQIAALKWVRDNIAAFGGDPGLVTIFGESAGASSVVSLMAMPGARGLFHRVIAQSGTASQLAGPQQASRLAEDILSELGLGSGQTQRLLEVPAADILEAQTQVLARLQTAGLNLRTSPVVDGETLPCQPLEAVARGEARHISFMAGTNRDEVKLFKDFRNIKTISDEELERLAEEVRPKNTRAGTAEMIRVYKESRARHGLPVNNENIDDAIHTDQRFRIPCLKLAEAHGQAHVYLFTWQSPARRGAMGACHALEMPFVFGTHTHPMEERFTGTGPEADRLSRAMMAAWIAFARSGDPNHEALGGWAVYDRKRRATMIFGRESEVQDAPFEEERAVWEPVEE